MPNPFQGLQAQAWRDLMQSNQPIRVVFQPRATYQGRPVLQEMLPFRGTHLFVRPLWLMDEDDLYPGEWALGAADRRSDLLGRMWIASGDVVICPEEVNCP